MIIAIKYEIWKALYVYKIIIINVNLLPLTFQFISIQTRPI